MKFYKDGKDLGMTVKPDQGALNEARRKMFEATDKLIMQRSETMTTYSTITAMAQAKAEPDTLFRSDEYDTTVVYHTTPFRRWVFTEPDKEWWYVRDMELHKELPKIQEGDWVRVTNSNPSNPNEYAQVTDGDEKNGLSVHFLGTQQGFLGNSGTFFAKNVEKVTDERKVMFLNHGREPNTFKPGDIVEFQKIGVEILNFRFRDKNNELKLICFVEDRKDRTDA